MYHSPPEHPLTACFRLLSRLWFALFSFGVEFPNTLKGEVAAKETLNMLEKLAEAKGIQQFTDLVNEAG